jgi:hypothetical protein
MNNLTNNETVKQSSLKKSFIEVLLVLFIYFYFQG